MNVAHVGDVEAGLVDGRAAQVEREAFGRGDIAAAKPAGREKIPVGPLAPAAIALAAWALRRRGS